MGMIETLILCGFGGIALLYVSAIFFIVLSHGRKRLPAH